MDVSNPLLQQCFQDAAAAMRPALAAMVEKIIAQLQAEEAAALKTAQREALAAERLGLQRCLPLWTESYPLRLLDAFDAPPPAQGYAGFSVSDFAALEALPSGRGELSLVDESQLDQGIDFARLLQQVMPRVDDALAELDSLVSAAQGLSTVAPGRNPLRAEVFAQVLRELVVEAPVEPDVRSRWLRRFGDPFGRALQEVYARLIDRLSGANVQAAGYRVKLGFGGRSGAGGSGAARATGAGGPNSGGGGSGGGGSGYAGGTGAGQGGGHPDAWSGGDGRFSDTDAGGPDEPMGEWVPGDFGSARFQDFLRRPTRDLAQPLPESYYAQADAELAALRVAPPPAASGGAVEPLDPDLPVVDRPVRAVGAATDLDRQRWGDYASASTRGRVRAGLRREATRVGQALGLDVVHGLVDQVAQDPRLLAPVREAIVALEPALGRLALEDPRFFSDESHPGRRLMERVAQRSLRYNDEAGPAFQAFLDPVASAFRALNDRLIEDAAPFQESLESLEQAWTAEDAAENARRQHMLAAMQFAEERQALADQIALELSQRSDLDKVPGVVLEFLYTRWSLVMAHARLIDTSSQLDPGGYGVLVSELLWSVKRDFTLRQPAALMEMIPGLLRRLNEGLDLIGQAGPEREAFFDALMRLHLPVLRLRRLRSERDAHLAVQLPTEPEAEPATPEQRVARPAEQPWVAPHARGETGLEAGADAAAAAGDSGPVPLDSTPASPGEQPDPVDAEQALGQLRMGQWADLCVQSQWLRAQLVWASARGTLFMFVSQGGRAHSMTRRSCLRLLRGRQLRPVAGHGVVAHALDALKAHAQA